jgi:cob(I)alamin adenosyltransferase
VSLLAELKDQLRRIRNELSFLQSDIASDVDVRRIKLQDELRRIENLIEELRRKDNGNNTQV